MATIQDINKVVEETFQNPEYPCFDCGKPTTNFEVHKRFSHLTKALMLAFTSVCVECLAKHSLAESKKEQ